MSVATPDDLHLLAEAVGIQRHWRDVEGAERTITDEILSAILAALGHETGTSRKIKACLQQLAEHQRGLPPMLVTEVGLPTRLPIPASCAELTDEQGRTLAVLIEDGFLPPLSAPGYYDLAISGSSSRLAVAPSRCPLPQPQGQRLWGTSLQIPSLRGHAARPFGALGELADAVQALGARGCQAVAINPVHALLPGTGEDFSPYSPSSRTFLNAAIAAPELLGLAPLEASEGGALIDWQAALPWQLSAMRQSFASLSPQQRLMFTAADVSADKDEDAGLHRHALHDALFCHFRPLGAADWRAWPAQFRQPGSVEARRFAAENPDEIAFHRYAQWLAREGLAEVQRRAHDGGMAIGLIADLAVGVRPGGSDCWAMPETMLGGLTIGAPPDPLGPLGQNWSITGFSPGGLRAAGYGPWIAMLRAALRSSGGLRIDHAFGLARLWVIPEGGDSSHGAYLSYPFLDLVRLVALEAHRASALIIAEDLGTAPSGFTGAVSERDMLGMRVLWFERAPDHGFIGAHDYPAGSVAMTGTHDTPTVAGWWSGRDLDWADRLDRLGDAIDRTEAEAIRDWDRGLLWSTIGDGGPRPAPSNPQPVVDAACAHIAASPALLAIAPLEDLLGEEEQPNLPGTTAEHPNWRRRLASPLEDLLASPMADRRMHTLSRDRSRRAE